MTAGFMICRDNNCISIERFSGHVSMHNMNNNFVILILFHCLLKKLFSQSIKL